MPGPVTIVGLLKSTVGLGEGARLALSGFKELGYETRYVDVGDIFYWHKNIEVDLWVSAGVGEGGLAIFHLNPPELAMVMPLLGRRLVKNKMIVGYWAWELEAIPGNWAVGFRMVDEIWVPSVFVAEALRKRTDLPVRVVHHPLRKPIKSTMGRIDFGLDESAFVVLTMFDMRSSAERKNPVGAVRAFRRAFGDREDVILIVKVGNPSEFMDVMNNIETEIGGAKNIKLMFHKLSREDHVSLMDCADVVLSLHRSEGFGLVLAEAMLMGKPVIATAYSGNMDFMDATCAILINYTLVPVVDPQGIYRGENQMWAEPDIESAAEWLKRLAQDSDLRGSYGKRAQENADRVFNLSTFEASVRECVDLPVAGGPA